MAKKKSSSAAAARQMESSVSPMLEVLYADPLFSVAAHPSKPILVLGLLTGHVVCHRYNSEQLEEKQNEKRQSIQAAERKAFAAGKIAQVNRLVSRLPKKWWLVADHADESDDFNIAWKTKRHKISCRQVLFDPLEKSLGENIYTVGADHIIKKALTETGRVLLKVDIAHNWSSGQDPDAATRLCHSATHPFLLTGTENGHVLVYDSTNLGKDSLKFTVSQAHDDAVNHILPMPAVLAYHYLTLGLTTLSHIDIRKGIVTQSDTQDDELLAMCYPSDLGDGLMANDTVLVAHGEGIATIWKNSKNRFGDQLSRIKINKLASIEAIVSTMNSADAEMASLVWCGDSEGLLHRVNYKLGKVMETRVHSPNGMDEVGVLDIDYEYRLISAGMDRLKIWSSTDLNGESEAEDNGGSSDDASDSDGGESDNGSFSSFTDLDEEGISNRENSVEDPQSSEKSDSDDSDSELDSLASKSHKSPEIIRRKRTDISTLISKPKRRAIDLNKVAKKTPNDAENSAPESEQPKPKLPTKQLSTKQLRNLQTHEHGIRRFEGL